MPPRPSHEIEAARRGLAWSSDFLMEAALVNLRFLHLPPEAAKPSVRSAWPFFDAARLVLSSDGAPPAALPWRVRKKAAKPASLARHVTVAKRLGIRSATTGQRNSTRVRSAVARPCRIPTPGKSPPGKSRTDAANHDAPADKSTDNTGKTDKTERCTPQRLALKNPLPEGVPSNASPVPRCDSGSWICAGPVGLDRCQVRKLLPKECVMGYFRAPLRR
jgi:hypothetical protein